MLRPILLLELPELVRTKLQSLGYEYIEDIDKLLQNSEEIPSQVKAIIDTHNIEDRIKTLNSRTKPNSAAFLWHSEFCNQPISIFHKGLDKLLNGGLPIGRITEICGPPGVGKTQMCLQFCVDVQIPLSMGGSAGEALYITTDFGFGVKRLKEIIEGSVRHFSTMNSKDRITPEGLLNGVNVLQTTELNELVDGIKNLKDFLERNGKIKLVIVDSFSLPFVLDMEDLLERSKLIAELLSILLEDAMKYKMAVVLTNQLTTIVLQNNKSVLKPCLGEGFGHRVHVRLLLDEGRIYLTKSIHQPQLYTRFEITKDGIR